MLKGIDASGIGKVIRAGSLISILSLPPLIPCAVPPMEQFLLSALHRYMIVRDKTVLRFDF